MAKKKTSRVSGLPPGKKRKRRTDEELIGDLKTRIEALRERQEARKIKESPAMKAALTSVRWIDKALMAAEDEQDTRMRHALADARKPLEGFLVGQGLKLPRARKPRGRRPRGS